MLHKCANPQCTEPFRRLSEGKLFLVRIGGLDGYGSLRHSRNGKPGPYTEHFWLCNTCAGRMTLSFEEGQGMVLVPLPEVVPRKPAVSVSIQPGRATSVQISEPA